MTDFCSQQRSGACPSRPHMDRQFGICTHAYQWQCYGPMPIWKFYELSISHQTINFIYCTNLFISVCMSFGLYAELMQPARGRQQQSSRPGSYAFAQYQLASQTALQLLYLLQATILQYYSSYYTYTALYYIYCNIVTHARILVPGRTGPERC